MIPFVVTPAAADDLQKIDERLVEDSHAAAERVSIAIETAMARLADHPMLGHVRTDLTSRPYRFWSVYSYLIVYQPVPAPIRIIRVLHGARDLPEFLKS
ncbi:MAG: type II toxin-antitoxin system RelE/ParE family toxin [Acidobacteriota bacterium]|nr:type II toxin-antitoxin system RelE/ParE family toxin [Acidobacteriota bacterium]